VPPVSLAQSGNEAIGKWIEMAAGWLSIEAEPTETIYPETERLICSSAPALLQLTLDGEPRFLLLLESDPRSVSLLGPVLTLRRFKPEAIRSAICHNLEKPLLADINKLLDEAGVPKRRQSKARAAILRERLIQ